MSKRITSFLVVAVALLLAMPAQAQLAKKRAKSPATMVIKTGPVKPEVLKKERAAIMKAKAAQQTEGQAFRGNVDSWKLMTVTDVAEQVQEQKEAFKKLMEENLNSVAYKSVDFHHGTKVNRAVASRNVIFSTTKSSRRASNRAEVIDAHGMITSPAEGESKMYDRSGFGYYVSGGQLYYDEQEGKTEIVETTDGVVYIKNFISHVSSGAWVKGTKDGNTITIPAGQVIYYGSSYGLYIAKCTYVDETTGWSQVEGDITLTVDGNTISLDGTDADNPVAAFWTDDFTFSGYGDYGTVFTYDPTYVAPQLIELPEGATVETWYNNATKVTSSAQTPYESSAKVSFVGDDVYLSGIFVNYPDSWIKGTISGTTVTFSGLQFIGEYSGYNIFAIGTDGEGLVDFQMTYDADAKKLTSVNDLLANAKEDAIYYLEWYKDIEITKDAPAEPEATTGANVDAVPYSNALETEDDFSVFGVIDSNKDGKTWSYSSSYGVFYVYSSASNADDWLISPAIKLEAGKKYHFAIDAKAASASYPEKFEVKIGTEPKASALTQTILEEVEVASSDFVTYENGVVEVAETGYYHFGIHATSDADMFRLMVKNFLVEAGAEADAPAAVTDFAVAQTPDKLEAVVSFKAPTKTVAGEDLTDLTKIEVLRDGNVIKSITGSSINWVASAQGYENAQDITAIDFGGGVAATFDKGSNSNGPKYYTSGTALRMYGNNTMTITGNAIKKVVFTLTGNENQTQLEANVGEYALDNKVGTWTGSASEIVFTVPSGKQARIQSIEIEYGNGITPGATISYADAEGLTVGTHVYQVIPYNASGIGIKSEEKSVFLSVALDAPYTFDFTQDLLELFTIIDNNNDGKTWLWNSSNGYAYYNYSSSNDADDYLITLPFNLKAGKRYNVIVNGRNSGYTETFEVKAGKAATVEGLTETVISETTLGEELEDYEGVFAPTEDGQYFFAIHATSPADQYNLIVKSLTIELAPELTAPAAVADLTATPGAEGALEANLAFTAPAKDIKGDALTSNVDVKIYRDGELVNTLTGVAAGSAQTWKDTNVENGKTYTYYVVAANESGDGMKSEKAKVFVGVDEFAAIENIKITGTTASTISFSWDPVTGANGGYVNTATAKYAVVSTHIETYFIWQYLVVDEILGTVVGETSGTFNYDVNAGEQDYKYFGVMAYNEDTELPAAGEEYAGGYTYALVGAPYELPLFESFTGSQLHYLWDTNATLIVDEESSDDDNVAVAMLAEEAGVYYFQSGKVNVNGTANPTLLFHAKSPNVEKLYVYASKDGGEMSPVAELNLTADYQTFKVSLANLVNTGSYVQFAFVAQLNTPYTLDSDYNLVDWGDYVTLDEIRVMDLYQYNLKAEIKAPASVVAGQKAKVVATITNEGENPAQDYTVTIKAGENVLTTVLGSEALASFATDEIEVDFEPSIFGESGDVTLTVTVEYENELNPDDNTATAIITVKDPSVPAPATLTATDNGVNGVDLVWNMPADARAAAETVTESFETEGDMGGFTTIDADGDGYDWGQHINTGTGNFQVHEGDGSVFSASYINNVGALTPDNWLVTPAATLDGTFSFWAAGQDASYAAEHFAVFVSTTSATDPSAFTQVSEEFIATGDMTEYTVDLSSFGGVTGYIAIRHFNVTDMFYLVVDDVTYIPAGAAPVAPVSFNVYYEQEKLANVAADVTTYTAKSEDINVGEHTFAVTAVYGAGTESKPVLATVNVVTSINQINVNGKPVDVYTLDGKLVRRQATSLDGLKGFYIINGKKVMVK